MQELAAKDFCASGFFALRTPLLPFDELLTWAEGTACSRALADPEAFARHYKEDLAKLRARLALACRRPEIREALFVASPSLEESLPAWEKDPDGERGERVQNAVVKYFQRMAARCTPFGLYAGGSVGVFGKSDRLRLGPRGAYVRHTRLDMDYLTALVDGLSQSADFRQELRYFPNSSLFEFGETLRYAEARLKGRHRSYFLVAATADGPLRDTIHRARQGSRRAELAAALVSEAITPEEALAYVDQVIDAQILVPDLAPTLTGPESIDGLLDQLHDKPSAREAREKLAWVRAELKKLDQAGLGRNPAQYRAVAAEIESLPADANLDRLFQVDMIKPATDLTLESGLPEAILDALTVLENLSAKPPDPLASFRKDFEDRYGDRQVPLLQVLDEDVGIGFAVNRAPGAEASPLLAGLDFPPADRDRQVAASGAGDFIQWKLAEALAAGADELRLEPVETAKYRPRGRPPLPDAFQVMGAVLPAEAGNPRAPRFLLSGLSGPSGARLLGRFCHGDPVLLDHVRRHLAQEESLRPEAVYCEIVHQSDGRIGNVLARPLLRGHELAFLGRSGAPPERILTLADLTVGVAGERVVLRAPALGREIVPRLTTAHNMSLRTMKVYQFLGALQVQGVTSGLGWDWGQLASQPRLPRVRVGAVVLAPAIWNVQSSELKDAADASGAQLVREILLWKERRALPRWVGLADRDNVLCVDFENPLSVLAFHSAIKGRPAFVLREMLPGPDCLAVEGPEGRFCNEVIIPMVRRPPDAATKASNAEVNNAAATAARAARKDTAPSVPTVFPPGSEWLYVKLYCGPAVADRLLCRIVRPLAGEFMRSGECQAWFFIRYADPQSHVRVRFRGEPGALLARVLPALRVAVQPLLTGELLWRFQIDTYVREMNRYGGNGGIEPCEEIFHHDSEAVLEILGMLFGDEGADERWRLTVKGMDMMLDAFDFDLEGKSALLTRLSESYAREFSLEGTFKKQILGRYRAEREALSRLLDPACGADHSLWPGIEILKRRNERCRSALQQLTDLAKKGTLATPLPEIAASFLHMHANRMSRDAARAQEAVIYCFLEQHYYSLLARAGKKRRTTLTPPA